MAVGVLVSPTLDEDVPEPDKDGPQGRPLLVPLEVHSRPRGTGQSRHKRHDPVGVQRASKSNVSPTNWVSYSTSRRTVSANYNPHGSTDDTTSTPVGSPPPTLDTGGSTKGRRRRWCPDPVGSTQRPSSMKHWVRLFFSFLFVFLRNGATRRIKDNWNHTSHTLGP